MSVRIGDNSVKIYRSHAKINIGLRIAGKRPDGYHNLESIFQEISLHDEISFRKTEKELLVTCDHPDVPLDEKNLCMRTFGLISQKYSLQGGVEIGIRKKIPPGAGLGGGSSNAATCLKAFNDLFGLNLSRSEMLVLASRIGSDVPFFIIGKTALVLGRGEVVIPVSLNLKYRLLIVFPNIAVPTPAIFKNLALGLTDYKRNVKFEAVISMLTELEHLNRYFYNDLEPVACRMVPEIQDILNQLRSAGATYASMSGSGSAVYGMFEPSVNLEKIARRFPSGYSLFQAKPVQ